MLVFIFNYLKKYPALLVTDIATGLGSNLIRIFTASLLGALFTAALAGDNNLVWRFLWFFGAAYALGALTSYIHYRVRCVYAARAMQNLRNDLMDKLQRIPLSYFEQHSSAQLLNALSQHTWNLQTTLEFSGVSIWVGNLVLLTVSSIYLFIINPYLFVVCLVVLTSALFASNRLSRPLETYSRQLNKIWKESLTQIQDTVAGAPIIRTFNLKDQMIIRFKSEQDAMLAQKRKILVRNAYMSPIQTVISVVAPVLCIIVAGWLAVRGTITAGNLIVSMQLVYMLSSGIQEISGLLAGRRHIAVCVEEMKDVLNLPEEQSGGVTYMSKGADTAIEFNNVTFAYGDNPPVLSGISFSIPVGSQVALVGESGSGKSTVLKLITQTYQEYAGEVQIMGASAAQWDLEAMRGLMSLVPQDIYLFPGTIYENIHYGELSASEDEVYAAAKSARAHDFILSLAHGYQTVVGERGIRLSGGQKQRIAIARAFLKNAPILLLDEPTSALDTVTENEIQSDLERLMEGRTVLTIAHRLSTIKNAKQVIVMDHGQIAETGTHDELLKKGGIYTALYEKQSIEGEAGHV